MKKLAKKGFTIAELTIAMMVVAGIAMILMPTLVADNEKQIFATSLKKVYTQLQQTNQAVGLLRAQGKISARTSAMETFKETIKGTTKLLPDAKAADAFDGYAIDGVSSPPSNYFVLKNGMFFLFDDDNLIVDVNGKKSPNTVGKDVFYFTVDNMDTSDTGAIVVIPVEETSSTCPDKKQNSNYCETAAASCKGCADRILKVGRIDYY